MLREKNPYKWVKTNNNFGITGVSLNLNLNQCQVLAEFASIIKEYKLINPDFNYPASIDKFFDVFKQFSPKFDNAIFDSEFSSDTTTDVSDKTDDAN